MVTLTRLATRWSPKQVVLAKLVLLVLGLQAFGGRTFTLRLVHDMTDHAIAFRGIFWTAAVVTVGITFSLVVMAFRAVTSGRRDIPTAGSPSCRARSVAPNAQPIRFQQ